MGETPYSRERWNADIMAALRKSLQRPKPKLPRPPTDPRAEAAAQELKRRDRRTAGYPPPAVRSGRWPRIEDLVDHLIAAHDATPAHFEAREHPVLKFVPAPEPDQIRAEHRGLHNRPGVEWDHQH